jgi:hypothetical protein
VVIEGLTVSVNYSYELSLTLPRWKRFCERIIVASSEADTDTAAVVAGIPGCDLFRTDVFYANGATFNKGAALEQARRQLRADGWVFVFDADILPPTVIPWELMVPGNLYGCRRLNQTGQTIREGGLPGYFWMFHSSDPVLTEPWFTSWKHAGCYDSEFERRWQREKRICLPFNVSHIGQHGQNWWGKGNIEAMREMERLRREKRSIEHERCQ